MTIKVYVRENFQLGAVDIWVADIGDGHRMVLRSDGQWFSYGREAMATEPDDMPSYRLREDVARPLLDALVRHFDGGEDTRSLRRDYDAERARVDRLVGALAATVERTTARPGSEP